MVQEDVIIDKLLTEIESVVASGVDVRLTGHDARDEDADPPEVILDWRASRLPNENGHNSHGGIIKDNNGYNDKQEHHAYFEFEAEATIRYYDEVDKDQVTDSIQMAFVPYESDAEKFDRDTREWEVAGPEPRTMMTIEPDWFESAVMITFEYVKRTTVDEDTITTVNDTVSGDDTIESVSTDVKTN